MRVEKIRKKLIEYYNNGYKKVIGFGLDDTIEVLHHLAGFSEPSAGCMEIGVHHGQMFLALNLLVSSSNKSYALDVFSRQDLNIDKSGEGDLDIFKKNIELYDVHGGSNVIIIEGDSTDPETTSSIQRCSYISIDGGHTLEVVLNDLEIASKLVTNDGFVIVDDYMNHGWPSVTDAIFRFMAKKDTLVPFASSKNKLWMCKITHRDKYYEYIKTIPNFNLRLTSLSGHEIVDIWHVY
jgi:hypothetical protein